MPCELKSQINLRIVHDFQFGQIFAVVEDRRDDFQVLYMSELKLEVQLSFEDILK